MIDYLRQVVRLSATQTEVMRRAKLPPFKGGGEETPSARLKSPHRLYYFIT